MTALRCLGRLLIIWAVIVPLLALPACRNFGPGWGLIAGLGQIIFDLGPLEIPFTALLQIALLALGVGLSVEVALGAIRLQRPVNTGN